MATDLERVVAGAQARLQDLKARYPRLDAWLVLAQRERQVDLGSDLPTILTTFPDVFEATAHRRKAEPIALRIVSETDSRRRIQIEAKLIPIGARLVVSPDVLIELRFETLNYALIAELRHDSLVDRVRTPQTAASIRIVLGTARELAATRDSAAVSNAG